MCSLEIQYLNCSLWRGESTSFCLHTYREMLWLVFNQVKNTVLCGGLCWVVCLICEKPCMMMWFLGRIVWGQLLFQQAATVWAIVTLFDSLHICCLHKWHAVSDYAVIFIVRCLSVSSVLQKNNNNTICQIDWKLYSALSAFSIGFLSLWELQQFLSLILAPCSW